MKTDSLFYRLFQSAPSLFFELVGQTFREGYRFDSVELKQTAFRVDGVFLPPETTPEQPIYFVEVQFQKDKRLYGRLFAEIFLYLRYHPENTSWRAVLIFAKQSYEPEETEAYQTLLNSRSVRRFYLDRLPENSRCSLSLAMLQLVVEPSATAQAQGRQVLDLAERSPTSVPPSVIIELVETIMVYKFPQLSTQEIAQMLRLAESAKETRVYQEGLEEGREEGREEGKLEGMRALILRLLTRRLSNLPISTQTQVEGLSLPQLEALGEALLSFASVDELQQWLESNSVA